jgi:hypothetical protein
MLRDTESLIRLRTEVIAECAGNEMVNAVRFLVVDDSAGTDPEVDQLERFDDVEILTPPFNLGHQRAIVFALRLLSPRLSAHDVVVTMDSDGEDMPHDVPRLINALTSGSVLALARRTKRSERWKFRLMYVVYRTIFRVLTGTTVRTGNFAAQRANSLAATIFHPSFDLCYSSTLLALGRPTSFVPCARGRRFAGESRMNTTSLMIHGVRMLMPFSERIAVRMLVLASTCALVLGGFLAAFGLGLVNGPMDTPSLAALAALVVALVTSLTTFVVLFSGFSQSAAMAMKGFGWSDSRVDTD